MPPRMFSVEGMMGLRSWRYPDGTANLRAVVAANTSIADGVASALKPRRTRVSPYPAAETARANRISKTVFQGFMSTSVAYPCHRRPPAIDLGLRRSQRELGHLPLRCEKPYRSDRKPARTSSEKSFGCSQAAKCPPLGSLLKYMSLGYARSAQLRGAG